MSLLATLSPISAPNSLPVGYIYPPSNTLLPKVGAIGLSAIAIPLLGIAAIGALGGNEWTNGLLGKIGGRRTTNPSPTPRNNDDLDSLPQGLYEALRSDNIWERPNAQSYTVEQLKQLRFYKDDADAIANGWVASNGISVITYWKSVRPVVNGVAGNPVGFGGSSNPSGLSGGKEVSSSQGLANPNNVLTPNLSSAIGWGDSKAINGSAALGIGTASPTSPKLSPSPNALGSGIAPSTAPPTPTRRQNDQETKKPETEADKERLRQEDLKREADRLLAAINGGNASITSQIAALGGIIGTINSNTQPDAQRLNAKNGSCDALNSPSCTQNLKDDIRNPINQNIDATRAQTTAILGNQATQNAAIASVAGKVDNVAEKADNVAEKAANIFDRVGNLWNNTLIDKAVNYLTLITVIHNAAMLSRGIADTLGSAIDSGLQALGLNIKDKDGNQLGVGQVIGKTTENIIKSVIGAENYTALNATWAQANRIYQASINLVSNVQNILDSTTAVTELTSNRVALLMNGLRNTGMVREDAYTSQTPNTTRVNAFMQKLENLEQSTSNVAMITGNVVSVQQSVNELKQNRTEFENAVRDKNTQEESSKTEKREESIFKINDFSITRAEEVSE